jgi:hypothetical protein
MNQPSLKLWRAGADTRRYDAKESREEISKVICVPLQPARHSLARRLVNLRLDLFFLSSRQFVSFRGSICHLLFVICHGRVALTATAATSCTACSFLW